MTLVPVMRSPRRVNDSTPTVSRPSRETKAVWAAAGDVAAAPSSPRRMKVGEVVRRMGCIPSSGHSRASDAGVPLVAAVAPVAAVALRQEHDTSQVFHVLVPELYRRVQPSGRAPGRVQHAALP